MLFKKTNLKDKIESGDTYSRSMQSSAQEEARVLYVSDDFHGIPHVHYERTLICAGGKELQGERVLSLDTFAKDFHVN